MQLGQLGRVILREAARFGCAVSDGCLVSGALLGGTSVTSASNSCGHLANSVEAEIPKPGDKER